MVSDLTGGLFTIVVFAKLGGAGNQALFALEKSNDNVNELDALWDPGNGLFFVDEDLGGAMNTPNGSAPSGSWKVYTFVVDPANTFVSVRIQDPGGSTPDYTTGTLSSTYGGAIGVETPHRLVIGYRNSFGNAYSGNIAAIKVFNSRLTTTEQDAEAAYLAPVKTGAWAWYNTTTNALALTDQTGNGRNLTGFGGSARTDDSDGPAVPVTSSQSVSPSGVAVSVAFGTPTIVPGTATLTPVSVSVPVSFGTLTIVQGEAVLFPAGIHAQVTFGTATIVYGGLVANPSGFAVPVTFGAPRVGEITSVPHVPGAGVTLRTGRAATVVLRVPPTVKVV